MEDWFTMVYSMTCFWCSEDARTPLEEMNRFSARENSSKQNRTATRKLFQNSRKGQFATPIEAHLEDR